MSGFEDGFPYSQDDTEKIKKVRKSNMTKMTREQLREFIIGELKERRPEEDAEKVADFVLSQPSMQSHAGVKGFLKGYFEAKKEDEAPKEVVLLHTIKKGSKIYEEAVGYPGSHIRFDHLDGMYSYCEVFLADGQKLGPVHLSVSTPLIKYADGYRIAEEEEV